MEFKNDALQARITVPDHPSVRQVLAYDSQSEMILGRSFYERLWEAAKPLIVEWDCPHLARKEEPVDPKQPKGEKRLTWPSLDDAASPQAVEAIKWAGLAVFTFRQELDELPKNS